MVIEKFSGKTQTAATWIAMFERECRRININQNQYPEVLRLFMDGSGTD